ncbi:MAG: SprT family zinc-dependent metalloprotease, partial [Caulobacteraceae bacterium]
RERRGWIAERLAARPPPLPLVAGAVVAVFGAPVALMPDGRRPRLIAGRLVGCGEGTVDAQLVARCLRREAREVFTTRAEVHCATLAVPAPPVSVNDPRTRWGSCSPAKAGRPGAIRLSWRLALAPWPVADYVVAHECAHLIEANHGPRFWALVAALTGDPRPHRAWLRAEGARLHAAF